MSHEQIKEPFIYAPVGTPSARGSAEVLGRGFNKYTDQWSSIERPENWTGSVSMLTHWDKFHLFPTAVRVGNFVYCIGSRKAGGGYGGSADVITYILIDIVPDPEDPDRLGRHVAYPYITNGNGGHSIDGVMTPRTAEQMWNPDSNDPNSSAWHSTPSPREGYDNVTETVDDTNFVLGITVFNCPQDPLRHTNPNANPGSERRSAGWDGHHYTTDGWRRSRQITGSYADEFHNPDGLSGHPFPRDDEDDLRPTYGGFVHTSSITMGDPAKAILSFDTEGSVTSGRIALTDADIQTDGGGNCANGACGWESRVYGWGGPLWLRKADGTYFNYEDKAANQYTVQSSQYLFAPVFDYNQFKTLYGNEWDWGRPYRGGWLGNKWLFEAPDRDDVPQAYEGFGAVPNYSQKTLDRYWEWKHTDLVMYGDAKVLPHYPLSMETPDSNESALPPEEVVHKYDEVDIASFTALNSGVGVTAVLGAVAVCNEDLIGKMANAAEAELKNMASSVMSAGSTALQGLQEKAGQVKDSLVANLPPVPEKITNLYDAITNLDLGDLKAVEFFKDKYGDLVPSINDLLSKFKKPDFDICSILSISHENSTNPENPTTTPLNSMRNNAVPQVGASQPVTNDSGLTKESAEESNRIIDQAWKRVEVESLLSALANPETAADESNAPKGWVPVIKDGKVVGHKKPPKGGVPVIEGGKVVGHREPTALGAGENPILSEADSSNKAWFEEETLAYQQQHPEGPVGAGTDQYHSVKDLDATADRKAWRREGGTATGWRARQEGRKIESGDPSNYKKK